jgi:hypothetical protein
MHDEKRLNNVVSSTADKGESTFFQNVASYLQDQTAGPEDRHGHFYHRET